MLDIEGPPDTIDLLPIVLELHKPHTFESGEFDNNRQLAIYTSGGQLVCRIKRTSFKNYEDVFNYVIVFPDGVEMLLVSTYCFDDFSVCLNVDRLLLTAMEDHVSINYQYVQSGSFCEKQDGVQQTECGKDGDLSGVLASGYVVACSSRAELGVNNHGNVGYSNLNQDGAGFGGNRVVVADGMGGTENAELAASLAVAAILGFPGVSLPDAVQYANAKLLQFNRFAGSDGISSDWKMKKCDTVLAALQISNDGMLKTAVLGDARIYIVHNGQIIWRSKEWSASANTVILSILKDTTLSLTPADFEAQVRLSSASGTVLTGLGFNCMPDYRDVVLPEGARIVMCTDGGMLPDQLLINIINSSKTPDEACFRLKAAVQEINERGYYPYKFTHLEKEVEIPAQKDNTTFAVVFPPA